MASSGGEARRRGGSIVCEHAHRAYAMAMAGRQSALGGGGGGREDRPSRYCRCLFRTRAPIRKLDSKSDDSHWHFSPSRHPSPCPQGRHHHKLHSATRSSDTLLASFPSSQSMLAPRDRFITSTLPTTSIMTTSFLAHTLDGMTEVVQVIIP